VSKATSSDGLTGRLFQQHKVLLEAGFSYDQAALILQVSQQRKAAAQQLESAGWAPGGGDKDHRVAETLLC
jgi:hypothetical protein